MLGVTSVSLEKQSRSLALNDSTLAAGQAATAATASDPQVIVKDFMFAPTTLKVKTHSTVTWVNQDDEPHTVISETGLFHSAAMDTHESFSFKFNQPGMYRFLCSIHPRMVGTIVVE
jgi:plastocyanin